MNQQIIAELMELLEPVVTSKRKAESLLRQYWSDKGAIIWTIADIHRAANEIKTVLTEQQARSLLAELIRLHNHQYGLKWEDLDDWIRQSGKGRDIKRRELDRFIHHDILTIDPPQQR